MTSLIEKTRARKLLIMMILDLDKNWISQSVCSVFDECLLVGPCPGVKVYICWAVGVGQALAPSPGYNLSLTACGDRLGLARPD